MNSGIRFLESIENLKRVLKASVGREPNTETAQQVSSCLQQGRLFFEAATNGALEIRPLLLSYGTIAFARATIVARTLAKLETLPPNHGVRDVSSPTAPIRDLTIKIDGDGTFPRIVRVARDVERVAAFENNKNVWIPTPSCAIEDIEGKKISLKDILSRIGGLSSLFRETFNEEPNTIDITISYFPRYSGAYGFRFGIPIAEAPSKTTLLEALDHLRAKFPFINRLNFDAAQFAWSKIEVELDNFLPGGKFPTKTQEIRKDNLGRFVPTYERLGAEAGAIPLAQVLPCSQGGLAGSIPTFAAPIQCAYLSEITLLYLAVYLLGSLVRYRPQIWIHSLYGHETPSRARDDAAQSLIEAFLDIVSGAVPAWCERAIRAPTIT